MFVDFKIDDTGDLIFQEQSKNFNPLSIKFNISKTKTQKIQFDLSSNYFEQKKSNNSQKITFFINNKPNKYSAEIVVGDNSLNQLMFLKLNTVLGELPNRSDFGSTLSTLRHKNIDDKNLSLLEKITESTLKDIIRNPSVKAKPFIDYSDGYNQVVKLEIFNNSNLLLEYIL